ncbi:MAG: hypothetical protein Q7S62_01525 [bacterium]|nr:hypothetical protein [bacterium]
MKFIPLDKSWIIRMGVLDLIHGYSDIVLFLNTQTTLSDDLLALKRACNAWNTDSSIEVGESGTLYRFLQFASWKLNLKKRFVTEGTLRERRIGQDSSIVNLTQRELLELPDEPTSQWASAAVLLGDEERLIDAPYKLRVTYEAVDHWRSRRSEGKTWQPREDPTIRVQAETFVELLRGERPDFVPLQAEDYCFARIFGYISREEGARKWPNLSGHESNRLEEMEKVLVDALAGQEIASRDHRVIHAIVMWGLVNKIVIKVRYPDVVRKSWPEFWQFIDTTN